MSDEVQRGEPLDCPGCSATGKFAVTKPEDDPTVLLLSCLQCGHVQLAEVELHARGER